MNPAPILLVEDNQSDVFLTRKAIELSEVSIELHVVNRGERALDFLLNREGYESAPTPALVLMDINLPSFSGLDLLKAIKTDERIQHIPVIMLTSSDRPVDVQRAYAGYANCYLTKPTKISGLVQLLKNTSNFWLSTASLPSF